MHNKIKIVVSQIDYQKVRLERAKQGKSITQLAKEANVNTKTISRIENSQVIPRPQTMGKIARALGIDYEDFYLREDK